VTALTAEKARNIGEWKIIEARCTGVQQYSSSMLFYTLWISGPLQYITAQFCCYISFSYGYFAWHG